MTEPLSSTASVIAVATCAAEATKHLFQFFRNITLVPDHVHQLHTALESLHITLIGLQRCGTRLDSTWQFPPHFCQRLGDCLAQLSVWADKIAKIDSELDKKRADSHKWARKAKRSWQKIKWLLTGEQEIRLFMENTRSYQAEFSLELLTLLISIHGSLPPPRALGAPPQTSSSGSVTRLSLDLNRQPQIQAHEAVQLPASFPRCSPDGALPNMWIQGGNPGGSLPHAAFDPAAGKHSMPAWINKSNASVLCEPQQCIRAWFFLRPDLPFFSCVLRGGPVFTERFVRARTTYPQLDRRNIGFGLGLSVCLQRRYRKRVNMEIFVVYTSLFRRIRLATSWNLDCQRIVPQQAVVFQYVRNGSLDGVKRLLGSGQASARDITVHGITLLHTASNLGNCELVRFLIEAGADVNAPDEDGETPLHRAMSMRNNYETAKILIENGADLANVAVGSRTPLHTIFNDTMGKVLTSEDWIEDMGPDSDGMSITHLLAWSSQTTPEVFERGRARDTIDLWSADHSGRTCLHFAASRGNLGLLKYLLDRASPFEIQQRDLFGHAVVHYAVRSSRMIATLELLVAKGAKMYATDSNNQNMLHHAAKWRQLEDIQQLLALDHKGSFLSPDKDGQLPSQCAHKRNSSEVYLYLRRLESAKRCTEETSKWQICQISRNKIVSMRFHYNPSTNPRLFMAWQMWAKALKALHKTLFARSYKKSFVLMIFVSLLLMMSLVPRTRGLSGIPA